MKQKTQLELRIEKMLLNEQFNEFINKTIKDFKFKNITNDFLIDIIMMNPNIYLKPAFMLFKTEIKTSDIDFTDCIKKYDLGTNKKVVINSINKSGLNLKFADTKLRNNIEIVKLAILNNGLSIEFASNRLRDNLELGIMAINNNPDSYYLLSENLKNNREIIKTLLIKNPSIIKSYEYIDKYNSLVKEVTKNNGLTLKYLDTKYTNNKKIVMSAVKNNIKALMYADKSLLSDQYFLIEVSKKLKSDQILYYANSSLQNDKEFIKRLIKETNLNLYFVNDTLKDELDLVNVAIEADTRNLIHASERIKSDKTIILDYIKKHGNILNYVNKDLLNNQEFMLNAIKEYNGCIKNITLENEEFNKLLASINDWCNNYIKSVTK